MNPPNAAPDAAQVWRDVLAATRNEDLHPIRVLLEILLQRPAGTRYASRLGDVRSLVSRFASPPRRSTLVPLAGQPCFLFPFNTPSNVGNLAPVYRASKGRWPQATVLLGERVQLDSMFDRGSDRIIRLHDLLAGTSLAERRNALGRAARALKTLRSAFDAIAPAYAATLAVNRWHVVVELATAFLTATAIRRVLRFGRPGFLVSTSDLWPVEHAVFAEHGRWGVRTFVVQHGLVHPCWTPSPAGKLLVWGQIFREELIALGAAPERLAICGMPASDHVFASSHAEAPSRGRESMTGLLLSHTHSRFSLPQLLERYGAFVRDAVLGHPEVRWVVKLHPNEDDAFYRGLGPDVYPRLVVLPKTASLREAVRDCTFALTLFSASGLEAMMLDRPLLVANLGPEVPQIAWWPGRGGGLYVDSAGSLAAFLRHLTGEPGFAAELIRDQHHFLRDAFANQGAAAKAVVSYLAAETSRPSSETADVAAPLTAASA